ncbi:proteasome subunit beta type-7-like [Narcine bancroftii]|uniref:proteasome subunit beta type-7-like n=1 Tax=Narcine bancroftii TaxID=1343680 RepID=UPI003831BE35
MFKDKPFLSLLKGGFSFDNCSRNTALEGDLQQVGFKAPKPKKTGTTIAGIIFKDGVILASDTRATNDMVVANKDCIKIHHISPKIYCCGAGVAADCKVTLQLVMSNIELHSLSTGRPPRVVTVNRKLKQMLFRYHGHMGLSVIIGGVDCTGSHLYTVYPHGSTDVLPYASMGSGSEAAMAILEDRFKPNMEEEEAKQLIRDAITAGIFCDLGSGSNVDLLVITKDRTEYFRTFDSLNKKGDKKGVYKYKQGTTAVLTESVTLLQTDLVEEVIQRMDTE